MKILSYVRRISENNMSFIQIKINLSAVIRGYFIKTIFSIYRKNDVNIGNSLRCYKGVSFRFPFKSNVSIGENVKIDKFSTIYTASNANLNIGKDVGIGMNDMIMCKKQIIIGEGTTLGPNVLIYDHDHKFDKECGVKNDYVLSDVIIGSNCWIGAGTIILKGSVIGDNCIIAAGSVIKGNYESNNVIIQKRNTTVKAIKDEDSYCNRI